MKKLLCVVCLSLAGRIAPVNASTMMLWYAKPATDWEKEALPVGNGRLGAMVFGGVGRERIQVNEDSLWTGDANPSGSYGSMGGYQAFGDIHIELGAGDAPVEGVALPGVRCGSGHKAYYPRERVKASCDGDPATKWCVEHKNKPVIWELRLPEGKTETITSYSITSANDVPPRDPRTWVLEGSTDGKNWTVLDRRENEKPFPKRQQARVYKVTDDRAYGCFRIRFLASNDRTRLQVAEIALGDVRTQAAPSAVAVPGYRRELDLDRAVHRIVYTRDGVGYRREYFSSAPDQVMVFRLTADKPGRYTGSIRLTDMHGATVTGEGATVTASGSLDNGLNYEARLMVLNEGGSLKTAADRVSFAGCDSLTLLLAAGTDYLDDPAGKWRRDHPRERVAQQIKAAAGKPYDQLLARHVADYQALFRRVVLDVGATPEERRKEPTDRRLSLYKEDGNDRELEMLLFQYGRYLIISSSRPGALPANLQGLWNHKNNAPWHSDYHSNINVQMNYWLTEPTNLAECHKPFLRMIDRLREPSKIATRADPRFEGVRGWTVRTSHNIFGGHGWKWNIPGSAWYAQHMWEHYAFGQDETYLRTMAYPVLREVCEFWEDTLKERPDGTQVVPDGWSPEHGPTEDGVSYDQQIVYDLFTNYIEAEGVLKLDATYRDKVADMRRRLLKPKVGKWGQLQEWETDRDDPKNHHRHVSHLFALHPGRQIAPRTTPELAKAAEVSLRARGDGGTGWSKAWKISFWARLLDGDHAFKMLSELLKRNIMPNFYDTHPPFQIDGNFGATAGVAEMLLQSHAGQIDLLPALPKAWATGSVTGLRARGAIEIDMTWKGGALTRAVLRSDRTRSCRVRYGEKTAEHTVEAGKPLVLDGKLSRGE